eukprot:TRINITY_DN5104_c0_g1_i1.p1 TRINITY_DN5104_c0_g1~~TRINITY_DN5104_c0_g1_i1.p1  ORF type:complete len:220 (+),score=56.51 TRINITY_DN5104_c0_g1_i1:165-824(+)
MSFRVFSAPFRVFSAPFCSEAAAAAVAKPPPSVGAIYSGIHKQVNRSNSPGIHRLNTLLQRIETQEQVDKFALPSLQLYNRVGIQFDQETAALFVKACCKAADTEKVVAAFSKGKRNFGLPAPGRNTLKHALIALERAGDVEGVLKLVKYTDQPDRDVYHMAIRACIAQGAGSQAKALEQQALEANVALSKQTVEALSGVVVETEVESPVEEQAEEKSA